MKIYKTNYEERLYSTGSDELDELLEKAFCDGYEFAQREFSKKKKEDDDDNKKDDKVKLKKGDNFNYLANYKLMKKHGKAAEKEKNRIEGRDDGAPIKDAIATGIPAAAAGALIGVSHGRNKKDMIRKGIIGGIEGATIGGFAGYGASVAGSKLGNKTRKKLENQEGEAGEKYRKSWEKQADLLALGNKDMTKEEFVRKWGGTINGEKVEGTEEKKMREKYKK